MYDKKDPKSIEKYALKLVGNTFYDVIEYAEKNKIAQAERVRFYGNTARKGGLGNLLEELYFGYKSNNNQEADFVEAGVELKATPYEYTKKGELRAGERLVITMIGYDIPFEKNFYKSHLWNKIQMILLVYYWRNKELQNKLMYKIGYVKLFQLPAVDLAIIKQDYEIIKRKIISGRAHELSESDTMYLGACTKGATAVKSTVPQYYNKDIPEHNLLVGGFPCQDYSVARGLNGEKGIKGNKGVLWWSICDVIKAKKPSFILLENVDRLLKSPSKQRGRDFGIILACLQGEGYSVEWRVINAAEYGAVQRRRRTFIFAYRNETDYAKKIREQVQYTCKDDSENILAAMRLIQQDGFFAKGFPINPIEEKNITTTHIGNDIYGVSESFQFGFENSGYMTDSLIYTCKTMPVKIKPKVMRDIMQDNITMQVDEHYYIPDGRLYYTDSNVKYSDETEKNLTSEQRRTWQYLKGGKKRIRISASGHRYIFSEGPISMLDEWDKPARTMLTSESSFNRSTHIVKDLVTGRIRLLTPIEAERIQGFPDNWTKECLVDGEIDEMPEKMRYFCMGNALVVDMIEIMEKQLSEIFEAESAM